MNPSPRDNFYRCMTLIVDNGSEAAWELLDYYLSKQGTTLKDFIENNQHEIYHLCYFYGRCCRCQYETVNKPMSRILYPVQLDILLDTKGSNIPCTVHGRSKPTCTHTINDHYSNPNIATKQLDLTLCRCLLINFTNILPQGSVERNAFEDVITMRNKCCHAAKGEISSKDYRAYKAQIEKCLLALAQVYGKTPDMQIRITNAEKRPFDESICKQLQETILQIQVLQGVSGLIDHKKSSREAEKHTASKVQRLDENIEKTLKAVEASQESVEITSAKLEKKQDENAERTLQVVKYTAASIEKKLEESSRRTIQAMESNQELVEHTAAKIQKVEENTEKTMHAIDSNQEAEKSTATKIQKLEERVAKCETSKRSRLIGLTETEINNHLTEETFVETPAVDACITFLETNSLLILTGAAGSGKSRNSLDVLNKFRIKHPEYEIIKLTELHDFTDIVTSDGKLVILFEDVFGRTNTRFTENTDIQIIDRLQACLNEGNVKAILTVRDTIKESCQNVLTSHKIFNGKCEVDLSSVEFKMSRDKKEILLLNYFKKFNLRVISLNEEENYFKEEILKENVSVTFNHKTLNSIIESEPLLGFPEACSLFTRNRKLTRLGIMFFKHPSKHLYDEIDKVRKDGKRNTNDKLLYVTLVYLLLNGDVLDENNVDTAKVMDIMKSCYGSQQERLLLCDIIDAAADMKGRYLTYRHDTFRYHFQHQTVLESVMISYSKIEQEVVISMLSFDFIREMVRLQNYRENEGEVIMKVSQTLYDKLAERIVKILQSQYFKRALTFNLQLLCDMQIIREDNEYFITSLLTASHTEYMCSSYNLETDILVGSSFRKFKLYFPASFLEYVGRQTGMHTSLTCMFDHLRLVLLKETNADLLHVCKYSLLQTFFDICEKDSENLLEAAWGVLKLFISFKNTKHHEYFQNIIDKACISCPITTLEWMFKTFNKEIFEGRRMLLNACQHKRLNSVKFLFKSFKHETFDFNEILIAAVKNVRKESNTEILQWLLANIKSNSIEMNKILLSVCEIIWPNDIDILLKNAEPSLFDSKSILKRAVRNRREGSLACLMRWTITNVNPKMLDLTEIMNIVCVLEVLEIGKLLIETIENKLLDVNIIMIAAIQKHWEEGHESFISWLLSNVDISLFDFKTIETEACKHGKFDEMKLLLTKTDHNLFDIGKVMQTACDHGEVEFVQYLLSVAEHKKLQVDIAMLSACSVGNLHIVDSFIENCKPFLLDIKSAMRKACICGKHDVVKLLLSKCDIYMFDTKTVIDKACFFQWLDVVKLILEKLLVKERLESTDHTIIEITEALHIVCNTWMYDNIYDDGNDITDKREMNDILMHLLFENVNYDSIGLNKILHQACRNCLLNVVILVLENTNHTMLNLKEAMQIVCSLWMDDGTDGDDAKSHERREKYESLIKLFIEKCNNDSFDLQVVLNQAFRYGSSDVVMLLFKNIDHAKLDFMKAYKFFPSFERMHNQSETYDFLMKLILEKVNHDLLDLKGVFSQACCYGFLDVVAFVLEHNDHKKLDIMEAVNAVYSSIRDVDYDEDYINDQRERNEPFIKLILEKVNHDLLDLKKVFRQACCYGFLDVVAFVLKHNDHKKLDIMEAVNAFYSSIRDVDYDEDYINDQRERYEPFIKLILEKVNHDLLDLKKVFYQANMMVSLDAVTYLIENTDHKKLDIMGAVKHIPFIDEVNDDDVWYTISDEAVAKLLVQKVSVDLLDMEVLMNKACRNDWLNIVRWLIENIAHSMFDIDTAMNILMVHSTKNNLAMFKLLLENISHNFFNIGSVIEQASRLNNTEKVLLILQTKDNSLFDIKYVMNQACRHSNLLLIKYVIKSMDKNCFDGRSAMNKACRGSKTYSLEVVKLLLENIPPNMLDMESAMNNACRYDNVVVAQWFWNNLDRKLFNVKSAWTNACYNCNKELISYLLYNMDENLLDKSKALSQACRNMKEGDKIISLIFKQPNMNTPENCKLVLTEACVHCNRNVVKWLMSHTDIQPIVYKTSLIETIKATVNMPNHRDKSDRVSIVQILLEYDSITKLGQNDMSQVMEAVSSIGQLDMVQRLWNTTEQSMFDMRAIVNTACESGQFEIVDWLLQKIEFKNIDVQTVMIESCSYGRLKIVTSLWSKFDIEKFDLRTSMYNACIYGRYEIVKFLLENVDSNLFDTKLVLENAYGYGWKDIIFWLFDNIDNISIDSKECMFEACAQGRLEIVDLFWSKYGRNNFDVDTLIEISCTNSGNGGVMKFLIENFDLIQSHKDIIVRTACKYGWTEIVTSILDSCKHNNNLMEEAMKNACYSGETEIVEILLEKVDVSFIEIKHAMVISCQKGWDELVSLLLERVDHSLFDLIGAMNEACRCGEADIVELLIQKVNPNFFNFDTAIVEACKSHLNENLVLILLNDINQSTSDIEGISKKAREYGWRKVSNRLKRMSY